MAHSISLAEASRVWAKVALLSSDDEICTTDLGARRIYHSITRRDEE